MKGEERGDVTHTDCSPSSAHTGCGCAASQVHTASGRRTELLTLIYPLNACLHALSQVIPGTLGATFPGTMRPLGDIGNAISSLNHVTCTCFARYNRRTSRTEIDITRSPSLVFIHLRKYDVASSRYAFQVRFSTLGFFFLTRSKDQVCVLKNLSNPTCSNNRSIPPALYHFRRVS